MLPPLVFRAGWHRTARVAANGGDLPLKKSIGCGESFFFHCIAATAAWACIGYLVALARHLTTNVFYSNITGSASSLAFAAPLVAAITSRLPLSTLTPLLGCVLLLSTLLIFYSYHIHQVKNYWAWTPAEREEFNGGDEHAVALIMTQDTVLMLWLATANAGLGVERVLVALVDDTISASASMAALLLTLGLCITEQWVVAAHGFDAVGAMLVTSIALAVVTTVYWIGWLKRIPVSALVAELAASALFVAVFSGYAVTVRTPIANYSARARATDVFSGGFHVLSALLISMNATLGRVTDATGAASKWPPMALFALANLVSLLVFTDLAAAPRSFLATHDAAQILLHIIIFLYSCSQLSRCRQ